MTTALLSALSELWPFLLAIAGVVFGWLRHLQAKAAKADAQREIADARAHAAQVDAVQAKTNEDAARAGADNAKVRRDEEAAAAVVPDASRVLHDEWGK
ncbi:hypothetical protein D3C81_2111630 [compost metagenome]